MSMLNLILILIWLSFVKYFLCKTEGAHSKFLHDSKGQFLWGLYWIWLGILSSVGLGTGLHTFLLFLGPFIAKVTLAAYECGSTDFPSPPYPDEIVCPENSSGGELGMSWKLLFSFATSFWFYRYASIAVDHHGKSAISRLLLGCWNCLRWTSTLFHGSCGGCNRLPRRRRRRSGRVWTVASRCQKPRRIKFNTRPSYPGQTVHA